MKPVKLKLSVDRRFMLIKKQGIDIFFTIEWYKNKYDVIREKTIGEHLHAYFMKWRKKKEHTHTSSRNKEKNKMKKQEKQIEYFLFIKCNLNHS